MKNLAKFTDAAVAIFRQRVCLNGSFTRYSFKWKPENLKSKIA